MAKPSIELIQALRNTASSLKQSKEYQWGHMGCCNCGFLAQEITRLSKGEIHSRAMNKYGDWNDQLNDYCPTSGLLMDDLITQMLNAGLDTDDLKHLEKLSDKSILTRLNNKNRHLRHNIKDDVILYLMAWANMLEEQWLNTVTIPDVTYTQEVTNR